jgi:hypothetical protein
LLRLLLAVAVKDAAVVKSWPITPIPKNFPYVLLPHPRKSARIVITGLVARLIRAGTYSR